MKKHESISSLKKKAWKVFSEYVRRRDKGVCFTCGRKTDWKSGDAGHYISRRFNSLFFDERNVNFQDKACNIFRYGASDEYALALINKYGPDILNVLAKEKRKVKQFTTKELRELIEIYKEKIKCLEKK